MFALMNWRRLRTSTFSRCLDLRSFRDFVAALAADDDIRPRLSSSRLIAASKLSTISDPIIISISIRSVFPRSAGLPTGGVDEFRT